jgi:hypothetical protein
MTEEIIDAGAPAEAANATEAVETKSWYETALDESTRGYLENKGFLKKDSTPEQVLIENAKAYRELEKFRGADEKSLLKIPSDKATPEEINAFYAKLGKPDSADKYEIKGTDGTQINPEIASWFKSVAFDSNLTPAQAAKLSEAYTAKEAAMQTAAQEAMKAEADMAMNDIKKEWGGQFDERMTLAKRAGQTLGLSEADIDMGVVALGPKLYNMLAKVGDAIGEDRRISGDSKAHFGMSPAGAKEKLSQYTPQQLVDMSKNQNSKEFKEWQMYNDIAYGVTTLVGSS